MSASSTPDLRRRLPAVDRLLGESTVSELIGLYGREAVRVQAQRQLDHLRDRIAAWQGGDDDASARLETALEELPGSLARRLQEQFGTPLRRVLNATGIFLHTNLGRAPLPPEITERLPALLDAYCDLEMDLDSGRRGDRNYRVESLLCALTGAPRSLVVNNNAAAMVLVLATLARGRRVLVSRGELVEIGGSFRIPDMLTAAGAELVEVGTTNRTRLEDYAAALEGNIRDGSIQDGDSGDGGVGLLLKVFPSNYRISGFTASVSPAELAKLGREHGVPLLVDEGSGLLRPHNAPQLRDHPSFQQLLADGCDLVCGSGDKLLGGPQAGLLAGRDDLITRCRRHPFSRALRPDRSALATLELVLRHHLLDRPLPMDRLWPDGAAHEERLSAMARRLSSALEGVHIVDADGFVGGGSAPERPVTGRALALPGSESLLRRLRLGKPAVVGYLRDGRLILDLRTVHSQDDEALISAVLAAASHLQESRS
ncbi:MAG: L-seryl-tRNA(Sec) selenium transferase [Acidobacteriota bacterium]|nr:L-seryl-tRNA(Sec) selenium transferase [Acidobacteriota bacterium]